MRARIKFQKTGKLRFISHLDVMRYFQKTIRRGGLPAAFTTGYSPHMILSFASPLPIGLTSLGEYFDLEMTRALPSREVVDRLNEAGVPDLRVHSMVEVPEGKKYACMAQVAAAAYEIGMADTPLPFWEQDSFRHFLDLARIPVEKRNYGAGD